jgi:signal transduction histidine kinase
MNSLTDKKLKACRILVVDDMEMNRSILHDLIITMGHEPLLAENGEAALKRLETDEPDLVLLDIMMPGIDGYQVLERMKQDDHWRNIPVIMITAVDEMDSAARCIQQGADDYLTKPFDPILLKARIVSSLGKKRAHDREQDLFSKLEGSYEELKAIEQARDSLANMIVHDLNNPLTIISATCSLTQSLAEMGSLKGDTLSENLSTIGDACVEMMRLIRGILDVSKLENGEMAVHLDRVEVTEMIERVVKRSQKQAEIEGLTLRYTLPEFPVVVQADKELLSRIIQNLVSNAIKHNVEGVLIELGVELCEGECVIYVRDNGMGIRRQDLDRIFDKFFQVAVRSEGKKYGVGMGLSFCKMATQAQKGRIWVESEEGEGAVFYVAFPLCDQ